MEQNEMPVGFAMALAMNHKAMQKFTALSEEKKKQILSGTNAIHSRDEMHQYVDALAEKE